MLKQTTLAVCDICGHTEQAKAVCGYYNRVDYLLPDGWTYATHNPSVHLCPNCTEKLQNKNQNMRRI